MKGLGLPTSSDHRENVGVALYVLSAFRCMSFLPSITRHKPAMLKGRGHAATIGVQPNPARDYDLGLNRLLGSHRPNLDLAAVESQIALNFPLVKPCSAPDHRAVLRKSALREPPCAAI
jgi:hypothetical protein